MSNGCGCEKGLLKWFRPPYARMFYVPCCMHDDAYDIGGTSADRKIADVLLFARMAKLIGQEPRTPWRFVWMAHVALLYYMAVRLFGRWYFNYNKGH